jgi:hypothetical protein
MFLCISSNPAIDKRLAVPSLVRGHVNRVRSAQGFPGGKSVHVAMVLQTLGAKPSLDRSMRRCKRPRILGRTFRPRNSGHCFHDTSADAHESGNRGRRRRGYGNS